MRGKTLSGSCGGAESAWAGATLWRTYEPPQSILKRWCRVALRVNQRSASQQFFRHALGPPIENGNQRQIRRSNASAERRRESSVLDLLSRTIPRPETIRRLTRKVGGSSVSTAQGSTLNWCQNQVESDRCHHHKPTLRRCFAGEASSEPPPEASSPKAR